jgi:hypothetical protein
MAQPETVILVDETNSTTNYSVPFIIIGTAIGALILFLIARRWLIARRRAAEKGHLEVDLSKPDSPSDAGEQANRRP